MRKELTTIAALWMAALGFCADAGAVAVGDKPALKVTTTDGSVIDLASCAGKLVLIDFWAGKAQATQKAQAKVKEVYEKYHDQGLIVVGINCDTKIKDLEEEVAE